MTSISELNNTPREISIGDTKLTFRQLKIGELFGYFENKIRNNKMEDAQAMAKLMEPAERSDFMVKIWDNMPSGEKLTNMSIESMISMDGIADMLFMASSDFDASISLEQIKGMVTVNNLPELTPLVKWINGQDVVLEPDNTDNAEGSDDTDSSEKKT